MNTARGRLVCGYDLFPLAKNSKTGEYFCPKCHEDLQEVGIFIVTYSYSCPVCKDKGVIDVGDNIYCENCKTVSPKGKHLLTLICRNATTLEPIQIEEGTKDLLIQDILDGIL